MKDNSWNVCRKTITAMLPVAYGSYALTWWLELVRSMAMAVAT